MDVFSFRRVFFEEAIKKVLIILVAIVFFFDFILFPLPTIANDFKEVNKISQNFAQNIKEEQTQNKFEGEKEEIQETVVERVSYHTITAYNSEAAQTDDSPCITANGFNVCEHGIEDTIAANFLKFGSKVRIPELFGDRVFVVRDRMNKRHANRVDIWMISKADAKNFGVKYAKIEVVK